MKNLTLVIMAAGIGSRFGGGIKQLEPVGPNSEIIMDMIPWRQAAIKLFLSFVKTSKKISKRSNE